MDQFLAESVAIVEAAQKNDVVVRILGGFGIYVHADHCSQCRHLQTSTDRLGKGNPPFTDLDLAAYGKQWNKVREVLERNAHLRPDRMINALFGTSRLVYYHPKDNFPIDVFFDKLDFSHEVSFGEHKRGRLELDYPTLGLADLLLEKLQVHDINRKDLIDMIVLLLGHDISEDESKDRINAKHVSRILASDWGFWYDAIQNLGHVKSLGKQIHEEGKLDGNQWKEVEGRVARLEAVMEREPKTEEWKVRSRVGTSKRWYREVTDL